VDVIDDVIGVDDDYDDVGLVGWLLLLRTYSGRYDSYTRSLTFRCWCSTLMLFDVDVRSRK